MKLRIPTAEDVGFQMAPMIDCVFQLMIFFMCAAHVHQTVDNPEIEVPVAMNSNLAEDQSDRRYITVLQDGTIMLAGNKVPLDTMRAEIIKARERAPNLKVFLRGDRRVHHKFVRQAMQVCAEAGVSDIIFAAYETDVAYQGEQQ